MVMDWFVPVLKVAEPPRPMTPVPRSTPVSSPAPRTPPAMPRMSALAPRCSRLGFLPSSGVGARPGCWPGIGEPCLRSRKRCPQGQRSPRRYWRTYRRCPRKHPRRQGSRAAAGPSGRHGSPPRSRPARRADTRPGTPAAPCPSKVAGLWAEPAAASWAACPQGRTCTRPLLLPSRAPAPAKDAFSSNQGALYPLRLAVN